MLLKQLFNKIEYEGELPNLNAVLITQDSRKVCEGAVFVCAKGKTSDGHDFAKKALEQGAICIVTQRKLGIENEVCVENPRKTYALLCNNFFENAAKKLKLIAVTGTNGKSTVTTLIKQVLEKNGHKVGLMGTIHTEIDTMQVPAKFTTPEAWDLHALFARMVLADCTHAVMEASSQALDQMRLYGVHFDVAVFTNLTQDHLDYHETMQAYFEAKKMLFNQAQCMVVNVDDEYGRLLKEEFSDKIEQISVSTKDNTADFNAFNPEFSASGVKFEMVANGQIARVRFPMPGDFSVNNALMAAAVAHKMGVEIKNIASALENSFGVKGRAEVLYNKDFTVLCDFAHTADAIEKVLCSIAPFVKGRLIALFGCAGERDAKKRPLMAKAIVKYADFAILTSDNPRKENPYDILEDVEPTLNESKKPYIMEIDRRIALQKALNMLKKDDVLVLCGKGHEDYQVVDGVTIYLDEHRIVNDWLKANGR